jgi:hypothetical protein
MTIFEKHIAYATVSTIDDPLLLISFLSGCAGEDLPDLILLNMLLPDPMGNNSIHESLLHPQFLAIPKVVWVPRMNEEGTKDCGLPGVRHFLKRETDMFELENNVREVDVLLRSTLNLA